MAEKVDLYDITRRRSGRTIERGERIPEGYFQLVVQIVIINERGDMLIQQRDEHKENFPLKWDFTAAGAAQSGETSQEAATRELSEELGLFYNFNNLRPQLTLDVKDTYCDVYVIRMEVDPRRLSLKANEVKDCKWATQKDVKALLKDGEFIPYYKSFIDALFEAKDFDTPYQKK